MKLDKKQVPQLVVLGVLVVLFVGFVSFQVRGPGNQAPAKSAKSSQPADAPAKGGSDADQADMQISSVGVFPDLAVLPARRDPFTPQSLPNQATPETSKPVVVRPVTRVNPITVPTGRVPRINLDPINPFSQGSRSVGLTTQPEPEKEEQFTLTGIVRGAQNVAIIRSSTGRYVVREGQYIDGRYKVLAVTGDAAVLVYKNRHIRVNLGGDKNAN